MDLHRVRHSGCGPTFVRADSAHDTGTLELGDARGGCNRGKSWHAASRAKLPILQARNGSIQKPNTSSVEPAYQK